MAPDAFLLYSIVFSNSADAKGRAEKGRRKILHGQFNIATVADSAMSASKSAIKDFRRKIDRAENAPRFHAGAAGVDIGSRRRWRGVVARWEVDQTRYHRPK